MPCDISDDMTLLDTQVICEQRPSKKDSDKTLKQSRDLRLLLSRIIRPCLAVNNNTAQLSIFSVLR